MQIERDDPARQGDRHHSDWSEPNGRKEFTRSQKAAELWLLYFFGWFADSIYKGSDSEGMGGRSPPDDERMLLAGGSDFSY
jgi:hypothetical protein